MHAKPRSHPARFVIVLWIAVSAVIACRPAAAPPTPLPPVAATPPPETPSPPPTAVATLNPIQAAIATQDAARAAVPPRPTAVPLPADSLRVASPDGRNVVQFALLDGAPYYSITHAGRPVIAPSRLGFRLLNAPPLDGNFTLVESALTAVDQTWTQVWGEQAEIRDHHNQLRVLLRDGQAAPRELVIVFRAFDDGVGFRYEFPQQPNLGAFAIMDELTEFALTDDHQTWWIGAYLPNRFEYLYRQTPLSALALSPTAAAHTPLTMQTADGLFLSIHEAALVDYSSMTLKADANLTLRADLVPWSDGVRVRAQTPLVTPWRTVQIAERPGDLITSYLILNLNEPNKLADASWIHPSKYIGVWWEMHLGLSTWGPGPNHGATTANAQRYIDFAAANGFDGVLVEGWNLGWEGAWERAGERFDFTTPYDDFDLAAVAAYARERGVRLIGHHETAGAVANYERQLEDAFALYQSLGVDTVKTGYVNYGQNIIRYDAAGNPIGREWHHGQYMVAHHQRVVETAARYGIMINIHEPVKDTGLRRTWPNLLTREGARGQEYDAWDGQGGNPPDHTTILPFTRLLAGPMDFTPGTFDILLPNRPQNRVNTTLAKQLALFVVIYSPLQMASDLPENYENQPAFQFIRDVPVDWAETRVLHAQIGDFVTVARRDRHSPDWYIGSITDEQGRTLQAALDFLPAGTPYVAEAFADAPDTDWQTNPLALVVRRGLVTAETVLTLELAPGGGQVLHLRPATPEEAAALPVYAP